MKPKKGIVVSNKMQKTLVVKVVRLVKHPKYLKRVLISKKYKVHDEKNSRKPGDIVYFIDSRPISKDKSWRLVEASTAKK